MLRNNFLPIFWILVSIPAQAEKPDVYLMDQDIPKAPFEKAAAKIKDPPGMNEGTNLPSPEATNKMLSEAGLAKDTTKWDQLDKDMLVISVRTLSIDGALKAYPKLGRSQIERLKSLATR